MHTQRVFLQEPGVPGRSPTLVFGDGGNGSGTAAVVAAAGATASESFEVRLFGQAATCCTTTTINIKVVVVIKHKACSEVNTHSGPQQLLLLLPARN